MRLGGIDIGRFANWEQLRAAVQQQVDAGAFIPASYAGDVEPGQSYPYDSYSAKVDVYIPGLDRVTPIYSQRVAGTEVVINAENEQQYRYAGKEQFIAAVMAHRNGENVYNYVLSPDESGHIKVSMLTIAGTNFLEKLIDAAPFIAGAALIGYGAGFIGTAGGAAELAPLPASGMTATGTVAPWAATAPEIGSGFFGTGVADIGALMGTTGGEFALGTGMYGVTVADVATSSSWLTNLSSGNGWPSTSQVNSALSTAKTAGGLLTTIAKVAGGSASSRGTQARYANPGAQMGPISTTGPGAMMATLAENSNWLIVAIAAAAAAALI